MKTNWQELSRKLNVLKENGTELYQGKNSSEALEVILGDDWLLNTLETFIEGKQGNELAIKTLRFISSPKAAEMAFKIYNDNKDSNQQKASIAVWALSDIRTEKSMFYAEEILDRPEYEGIAISVIRNLIFDHLHLFEKEKLFQIIEKISDAFVEEKYNLKSYLEHEFRQTQTWFELLDKIEKRPMMYNIQKVEDIFQFYCGYAFANENNSVKDSDLECFETNFTNFVIKDYNAPSHCNWCTAIRLYSTSDDGSVELFFEELAKYKSDDENFDRLKFRENYRKS
jgi:hypothetical protein